MSVIVNPKDSKMRLILQLEDAEGNTVLKAKTFSNIKLDAEDQAVFEAANAFSSLQEHMVSDIERVNTVTLS